MYLRVGVVGLGNVGGALIKAMAHCGSLGTIYGYDIDKAKRDSYNSLIRVKIVSNLSEIADKCDTVFVCVPTDGGYAQDYKNISKYSY